jgi:hypothetical protein
MSKLVYILIINLFVLNISANAQQLSRDFWHDGEVNLFSGETLKGKLRYDLDNDNIQLQYSGALKSFSAYQVESFEFFDEIMKTPRAFYALPYSKRENYESPVFFELYAEGSLSLLNREIITYRMVYPAGMGFWGWGYRPMMGANVPILEDSYYILKLKEEKVIKITDTKREILELMQDKAREVEGFIQANRIRMDRRSDLIRLFEFYNSLKSKDN